MRSSLLIACLAGAGLLLTFASPAGAASASRDQILSNERSLTTWAYPNSRAIVRSRASLKAPAVARLQLETEDGFPEVYVLLRSREAGPALRWIQIRIPGRPNGRKGWVRASALGSAHVTRWRLRIDRTRQRATLFHRARPVWSAPVGVGAPGSPTPAGRFWVREVFEVPPGTIYGPYALGTSAYSRLTDWPGGGVVGIHGTNEPWLVPGRPSHGCIRMRNRDITFLARHLTIGSPILIR